MKNRRTGRKSGIAEWFGETFRIHTKEEYRAFFTRGMQTESGNCKTYPWMYTRAFALCFILFSAIAIVTALTAEVMAYIGFPTMMMLGGLLFNLPILVLIYELYPKKDLSFLWLCGVTAVCSVISAAIVNFGYFFVRISNEWLGVLWTAGLEEFAKAVPLIAALLLFKKRVPMQGFVIGAAVGVGMSFCEDLGYIFLSSVNNGVSMPTAMFMTLLRAFTSIAGHVVWAGIVGWAFVKFRRPLLNFRFWLFCLFSVALHFLWDIPLGGLSTFGMIAAVFAGLLTFEKICKKERRILLEAEIEAEETQAMISETETVVPAREYHGAGISATATALALGVIACLFCGLGVKGGFESAYYETAEQFVAAVQDGLTLNAEDRAYDSAQEHFAEYTEEGTLVKVTQLVTDGEYRYYYVYSAGETFSLDSVTVEIDGIRYERKTVSAEEEVKYFPVLSGIGDAYYDSAEEDFIVERNLPVSFDRTTSIACGAAAGGIVAVGTGITVTLACLRKKRA